MELIKQMKHQLCTFLKSPTAHLKVGALTMALAIAAPSASFAQNCGGVCNWGESEDSWTWTIGGMIFTPGPLGEYVLY